MAKLEMDIETALSPEGVVAALTDFSDRRPDIWPDLDRSFYKVISVGETSAVVQEGTSKPFKVWARERYDWSTPGAVTWVVEESDTFEPGYGLKVTAEPGPAGGSRVHITWERVGKNFAGRMVVRLIRLLGGKPISSSYKKAFDDLATRS